MHLLGRADGPRVGAVDKILKPCTVELADFFCM
jgi:hypothetical protein